MRTNWSPRVGDWVQVRPFAEISATLDGRAELDRLPYMPEMLQYCGRRFQVTAVAHKTCDTVNRSGGRRVDDAVHLADLRCDGQGHGGCQAACLLFWKLAWLMPATGPGDAVAEGTDAATQSAGLERVQANCRLTDDASQAQAERFRCQATTLPDWTHALHWWDLRQYWRDLRSGNARLSKLLVTLLLAGIYNLRKLPVGYSAACRLYEWAHQKLRGMPDPHVRGTVAKGQPTPDGRLHLKVGEVVRILPKERIRETLNARNQNRGLQVDVEMTRFCGGEFRVAGHVTQIINERTGEMMHFKNPCVVLDGVTCRSEYSDRRLMCPRRITPYWREIWLERVAAAGDPGQGSVS